MVDHNSIYFIPTRLYGLVGHPLGHSFSKGFFTEKFKSKGINASYLNFDLQDLSELNGIICENPNLIGLNVTIPYKERILALLDELDKTAERIGAVNTIKIIRSENSEKRYRLIGFNTDIIGFTESIAPALSSSDRLALVLGSGGASKAICMGLIELGISPKIVSRTKTSDSQLTYADLSSEIIASHTIIVNTTPLGMWPDINSCPDLPYDAITPDHVCFDAVYNPSPTKFLRQCAERGATIIDGLEMLRLQALASWKIWNDDAAI